MSSWPIWYLAALAPFGVVLVAVAAHDARFRRIPNRVTYPSIGAALALALVQPVAPWWSFVFGGVVVAVLLAALHAVSGGGIGLGDVKLGALIGLLLGWPAAIVGLFVAFACGAVASLALIAGGRLARRDPVPFAPALAVGGFVGLLGGPQLARLWWPFPI